MADLPKPTYTRDYADILTCFQAGRDVYICPTCGGDVISNETLRQVNTLKDLEFIVKRHKCGNTKDQP